MPLNVPLLRACLHRITSHPEEWEQAAWACRTECATAYCLAGHAVLAAGHTIPFAPDDTCPGRHKNEATTPVAYTADGTRWYIEDLAQAELGLTDAEAAELFHGEATLPRLWRFATQLTGEAITTPAELPTPQPHQNGRA